MRQRNTGKTFRMEGITDLQNEFMANKDISFSVNRGEIHALIRENSAEDDSDERSFGLENCQEGKIFIEGEEGMLHRQSSGCDRQRCQEWFIGIHMLVPNLTVAEKEISYWE